MAAWHVLDDGTGTCWIGEMSCLNAAIVRTARDQVAWIVRDGSRTVGNGVEGDFEAAYRRASRVYADALKARLR